jgi:hypothetical protein
MWYFPMPSCVPIFPTKASATHAIDWLRSRGSIKDYISPLLKGGIGSISSLYSGNKTYTCCQIGTRLQLVSLYFSAICHPPKTCRSITPSHTRPWRLWVTANSKPARRLRVWSERWKDLSGRGQTKCQRLSRMEEGIMMHAKAS